VALQQRLGLLSERRPGTGGADIVNINFVGKIMSSELAKQECKSCESGTPPLKGDALKQMQSRLGGGWKVLDEQRLEKQFKFPDFLHALEFVNRVGEVAEEQNHHPDIYFTYGQARIQIWTHSAQGLTENDFILAAKIDELD
jgi:4a-hydroxytetrahydrobiopterin dehydratase